MPVRWDWLANIVQSCWSLPGALSNQQKATLNVIHMMQRVVQCMLKEVPDVGSLTTNGEASVPRIRTGISG